jgi:hypothetical protein
MSSKSIDILSFISAIGDKRFLLTVAGRYPPVVSAVTHSDVDALSNPLQRHYRDTRCARVNFPQEDVVLLAAGPAALEEADRGR